MQRIVIHNFGPIKELDIEIKDFIVLIGQQASGKSTIAKMIYYFKSIGEDLLRSFKEIINNNLYDKELKIDFDKVLRQKFLDFFGASKLHSEFYIGYFFTENVWISLMADPHSKFASPNYSIAFQGFLDTQILESSNFSIELKKKNASLLKSSDLEQIEFLKQNFINSLKNKVNDFFRENKELIFIPAGRSLLATLADQLHLINPHKLDFLMRAFVDKINLLRPLFNKSLNELVNERVLLTQLDIDIEKSNLAENIITKILKGKYQFDKDGEKIYLDSNNFVKLNFSSSGQQESLWILLLVFLAIIEKQNVFMVIEEPEAHLFPEAQKEICNLIALLSNQKQSQIIITTHSPYILASVNNLILAQKVGENHPKEVATKINANVWISHKKVFAAIVQNGTVCEIIDNELDIIQQEKIDSASQIINEEFDFLYQFES